MNAWEVKRRAQLPEWRQRVEECRSSGLSVREWCAGQQISPKTYYRWEREILDLAGKQLARREALPPEATVPAFAELPVVAQRRSGAAATIHADSVTVDIHAGASAEIIAAICKSLSHVE